MDITKPDLVAAILRMRTPGLNDAIRNLSVGQAETKNGTVTMFLEIAYNI